MSSRNLSVMAPSTARQLSKRGATTFAKYAREFALDVMEKFFLRWNAAPNGQSVTQLDGLRAPQYGRASCISAARGAEPQPFEQPTPHSRRRRRPFVAYPRRSGGAGAAAARRLAR